MCAFKTSHDLMDENDSPGSNPASSANGAQRSSYCYLFADLANHPDAGCFAGTDEAVTLQRLKDFETSCHLPLRQHQSPGLMLRLPAAYTYFGQFMNHDISAPIGGLLVNVGKIPPVGIIGTADPAGLSKQWRADVATILEHFVNEHGAPLTLASLYGDGPQRQMAGEEPLYEADGKRFRLAETFEVGPQFFIDMKENPAAVHHAKDPSDPTGKRRAPDICRKNGFPLIADQRNDGNLILSQLHLAFMLIHNKAVTALEALDTPAADCFGAARELVTLHYHWLILNDFLPGLLSRTVLSKPLSQWVPREMPANSVPMEFTTAAFRFGHSMVGRVYDFNENFGKDGRLSPRGATLMQLFNFTSHGRMGQLSAPLFQLPDHWVIDWDRMTKEAGPDAGPAEPQSLAERIDLDFAPSMLNVAGDTQLDVAHGSILFRNLLRGFHRRMPSGQKLAEACNVRKLEPSEVRDALPRHQSPSGDFPDPGAAAESLGLLDDTPAWLYMMCEAQAFEQGERVGPTASQIIADTVISLMRQNPASVLRFKGGGWHPRDSLLKDKNGDALDSIRAFLMFATEGPGPI